MSVVFPITEDLRYRRYTASEGQVTFGVPFVFQDGRDVVFLRFAGGEYVEIMPSGYTLTGAGSPTGGSAVFSVGWPAGTIILVLGRAVLDRISSIVANGIYKSALIDGELDRNRLIQQEQARDIGRALKVAFGQPEQEVPVPDGVSVLGWSADGKLINRQAEGASAEIAEAAAVRAELAAATLTFSTVPELEQGDADNRLVSPFLITHAFKYRDIVTPLDFGTPAVGNDITDLMLDAASAADVLALTIPGTVWNIEDTPVFHDRPFSLFGTGKEKSQLIQRTPGKNAIKFISTQQYSRYDGREFQTIDLNLRDIGIISAANNSAAGIYAEWVDRVDDTCFFSAQNVKIMADDFGHYFGKSIHLKNCNGTRMDNVQMRGQMSKRGLAAIRPYDTDIGVFWDSGTAFQKVSHVMTRVTVADINTAFKATGSMEGFYFYGCDPALVADCFDFDLWGISEGGVNSPNLHVVGGHLNFRRSAFRLKDIYNVFLQSVDMLHDGESLSSIDSDFIYCDNVPFLKVHGSNFGNRGSLHTGVVRGIHSVADSYYMSVLGNTFNGIKTEHVNVEGNIGQLYAKDNVHLGGAGYVGYRTGANITGTIDSNDFVGTFTFTVDAANPAMVVKGNSPENGLTNFITGDTTPSVGGENTSVFAFNNASATTVTTFDDGRPGQQITVVAQNGNTTIQNSAGLILRNTTTRVLIAAEVVRFVHDGATWREVW